MTCWKEAVATKMAKVSPEHFTNCTSDELNWCDLEFDAPQWADLSREKEKEEKGLWSPVSDLQDSWFQQSHPLHEPKENTDSTQTPGPLTASAVDRLGNKLSLEVTRPPKHNQPKPKEKENTKSKKDIFSLDLDDDVRSMLEAHNRRIMNKKSEYDLNGRKIRRGNPITCPAPARTQSGTQPKQAKLKSKRRSVNMNVKPDIPREAKQKRRSCFPLSSTTESSSTITRQNSITSIKPTMAKGLQTKSKASPTGQRRNTKGVLKQKNELTDTENEIQELIRKHNSRLAAKRAKK